MRRCLILLCLLLPLGVWGQERAYPLVRFRVKEGVQVGAGYLAKACPDLRVPGSPTRCFPHHSDSGKLGRWYELRLASVEQVSAVVGRLSMVKSIEVAEPFTAPEPLHNPNDPDFTQQVYLRALGVSAAWDSTRGDTSVVVGIVDSGTDPRHPDLFPNLHINFREIAGNGIDDDHDGYIDNRSGVDLAGADQHNPIPDGDPTCAGAGGASHGVHVAGIAAAATNNLRGGVGLAYNCRFLPVKVAADNATSFIKAWEGIVYAADHGAFVINCSFASGSYSVFAADAVAYCQAHGCLVVAGAGNTGGVGVFYPANFYGVLTVAAGTSGGDKASISSYGPWVGLMAPGENIYSTEYGGTFGIRSGTSMASPMVAGAAALVKAAHRTESATQIAARLLWAADTTVFRLPTNIALRQNLGAGRVRLDAAIAYKGPGLRPTQPVPVTLAGNPLTGTEDTIKLLFDVYNYLAPTRAAHLRLTCLTAGLEHFVADYALSRLATGAHQSLFCRLALPSSARDNESLVMRFAFTDSGYAFKESRIVMVNPTTLDWSGPHFSTTTTSNGRLGFLNTFSPRGLGITYGHTNRLYEAGYLMALGGDTAYSIVRGNVPGQQSNDFLRVGRVRAVAPGPLWKTEAFFTDANSAQARGLQVHLRQGAGRLASDSNIIVCQATVFNPTPRNVRQAWLGLFADWDIAGGGEADRTGFDSTLNLTYARPAAVRGPCFGILPLTSHRAGSAGITGTAYPGQPNMNDGWSDAEKALVMKSGNQLARNGAGPSPTEVANLSTLGPFSVGAGDSAVLAHAIVFAYDSATLMGRARAALALYRQATEAQAGANETGWHVYPNPADGEIYVHSLEGITLELYAATGQRLSRHALPAGSQRVEVAKLPSGLYFLRDEKGAVRRLVLSR